MNSLQTPSSSETRADVRIWYRYRWLGALLFFMFASVLLLPTLIAKTPLRDQLIRRLVGNDRVVLSTRGASFGYWTSLRLDELQVQTVDRSVDVSISSIVAERSWLGMLLDRHRLGSFSFDRPQANVVVRSASQPQRERSPESAGLPIAKLTLPTFKAHIRDAGLTVRDASQGEPSFDLQGLQLEIGVDTVADQPWLIVEPTTILDRQVIRPELCRQGLQLVAPMLANSVDVQGSLSFRIDEFRVPLDEQAVSDQSIIRGAIGFENVKVGPSNPLTKQLIASLVSLFGTQAPEHIAIAESSKVEFRVMEGRVHHEGLTFLLPLRDSRMVDIQSSGSVGFDETLDLRLAIILPLPRLSQTRLERVAKFITERPIEIRVGGTVDSPKLSVVSLETVQERVRMMLGSSDDTSAPEQASPTTAESLPVEFEELTEALIEGAGALIENWRTAEPRNEPRIRDSLRQRRESRRQKSTL